MGKYPNSPIHDMYSHFHYKLIEIDSRFKKAYVSDIDRIWIEHDYDNGPALGVIDLKWIHEYDDGRDAITSAEKCIYDWFESKGVSVYIVYVQDGEKGDEKNWDEFIIRRYRENDCWLIEGKQKYGEWLMSLRNGKCIEKCGDKLEEEE